MQIKIRPGYDIPTLTDIPDVRILIDVFRASTTSLAILESKAQRLIIANNFELIQKLSTEGYLVISEVFDLGIDNSPTLIKKMDLNGRNVVLKTNNLTTALAQNICNEVIICCFNNLSSVVQKINSKKYQNIEIVPAGFMAKKIMNLEDMLCAETLKKSLIEECLIVPDKALLEEHVNKMCDLKTRPPYYRDDITFAIQSNISTTVPCVIGYQNEIFEIGF